PLGQLVELDCQLVEVIGQLLELVRDLLEGFGVLRVAVLTSRRHIVRVAPVVVTTRTTLIPVAVVVVATRTALLVAPVLVVSPAATKRQLPCPRGLRPTHHLRDHRGSRARCPSCGRRPAGGTPPPLRPTSPTSRRTRWQVRRNVPLSHQYCSRACSHRRPRNPAPASPVPCRSRTPPDPGPPSDSHKGK